MKRSPVLILCALLAQAAWCHAGELFDEETLRFARRVDVRGLARLGVQYRGRVAILDTVARDQLSQMLGVDRIDNAAPTFAYQELYFNAGSYLDRPVIYVREENMRRFLAGLLSQQAREAFRRTGRLPPGSLMNEDSLRLLRLTGRAPSGPPLAEQTPSLRFGLALLAGRGEFRVPLDRLSVRVERAA